MLIAQGSPKLLNAFHADELIEDLDITTFKTLFSGTAISFENNP